ncbi:hypothetical protein SAMN05428945_5132 [Streptomyces sp. 2224.1]|nr:hypothetical protein BX261_0200 [Streptomyces sp. 2321.6]SDR58922.1 hypothetical protein SAMN05216511_7023 [Streptomyces sp. KS_16]SEB72341.1 hypothetical protein SAMN05428940_0201 [Streptomyces sp. 2133.1]SED51551.1 hypothetical protein SAMN05428945_5132 [Streptomyces sp. 2224.1]SEF17841.1 hypothetical protein SAMN05428954_7074 [Streptomyces sp. 2112.3]SNC60122.1 hypothetical protein SAMN06272741_0202 [Streptomyces sp. 2114.4]
MMGELMINLGLVDVLRSSRVPRLAGGTLVGRIPNALALAAIPMQLRYADQSWLTVGAAAAVYSLLSAAGSPIWGRMVDRGRARFAIWLTSIVSGFGFLGFAASGHSMVVAFVALGVAGVFNPPFEPYLRSAWPRIVRGPLLMKAYAFDSASQELLFIVAPLVATASAIVLNPTLASYLCMAFLLLGAWMIEVMPTADAEDRVEHMGFRRIIGPLFFGAFRLLMCCAAMIGVTIGAMAILGGRLTESHTSVGGVGILLSLHGCGAFIGALTLSGGDTEKIGNLTKRLTAVLVAFSASWALAAPFFPVLVQESSFFFAGFFMGPALTWTFALVNASIPKGEISEAFSWLGGIIVVGSSGGSFLAGTLGSWSGQSAVVVMMVAASVLAVGAAATLNLRPARTSAGRQASPSDSVTLSSG